MDSTGQRNRVFVSYSRKDAKWLQEFKTFATPVLGDLALWDDTMIRTGKEWLPEIMTAIGEAKAALLMVSPDFLASRFIRENELPPILDAAAKGQVTILWAPLRASLVDKTEVGKYNAIHDPSEPIADLSETERARVWRNIVEELLAIEPLPPQPVPIPPTDYFLEVDYQRSVIFLDRKGKRATLAWDLPVLSKRTFDQGAKQHAEAWKRVHTLLEDIPTLLARVQMDMALYRDSGSSDRRTLAKDRLDSNKDRFADIAAVLDGQPAALRNSAPLKVIRHLPTVRIHLLRSLESSPKDAALRNGIWLAECAQGWAQGGLRIADRVLERYFQARREPQIAVAPVRV